MEKITLQAEFLFEFRSMNQWVTKAAVWFKPHRFQAIICIDKNGDVCHIGADFMYARDNDLFPVKAYKLKRTSATSTPTHH